jgi:hypothetical protein
MRRLFWAFRIPHEALCTTEVSKAACTQSGHAPVYAYARAGRRRGTIYAEKGRKERIEKTARRKGESGEIPRAIGEIFLASSVD